jgi:hypothetical protein
MEEVSPTTKVLAAAGNSWTLDIFQEVEGPSA